jgi:hypothetical protein
MSRYIFIAKRFVPSVAVSAADCDATLSAVSLLEQPRFDGLTECSQTAEQVATASPEKPTRKLRPEEQSQLVARAFVQ